MTLDAADYARIRRALVTLANDHRAARDDAEARAKNESYEFRRQALEAANWHAAEINAISLLNAKVQRLAAQEEQDT